MSGILKHFNKKNLHHAYLIEGAREEVIPEIFAFMETLGVATSGNPDFCEITMDNFRIDEALELRRMAEEKSFFGKKIFVVSANKLSLDAEHALLKMFEEPVLNTHFFLIVPDASALLRTLFSRFYFILARQDMLENKDAEKFIRMSINQRIDFLKNFLQEEEIEDNEIALDSARAKSLRFLNELEKNLFSRFQNNFPGENCFNQIFQVRKFLRQPGSSTKSLMESVALVIPEML